MVRRVYFDFETRSLCDLRKRGLWNYAHHESTEVILLSWAYSDDDGPAWLWDVSRPNAAVDNALRELFRFIEAGGEGVAQNAMFEYLIWNQVLTRQLDAPELPLTQLHDLMAQAQMCALPGNLEEMVKALGFSEDRQKLVEGKGLIRKFCIPREPTADNPHVFNRPEDFPEAWELFRTYGQQDSVILKDASEMLPAVEGIERDLWLLTQRMNLKGVPVDLQEIEAILMVAHKEKAILDAECSDLTGGEVEELTKVAKLKIFLSEHENFGTVGSLDADHVDGYLQRDDISPRARRLLELRQQAGKSSVAKYQKILDTHYKGHLHGLFTYCGAGRTGRFSSRGGLNLQNLPRPPLKNAHFCNEVLRHGDHELAKMIFGDQLMDAVVSAIRGVVRAPDGHEFVDSDFSGIENRVCAWLVGDQLQLQKFASEHYDEYREFATEMWPVTEDQVTGSQRQIAKAAVLAGDFGQSGKGFQEYARIFGVELTLEEATDIMTRFRDTHPRHVQTWRDFKTAMFKAVENPGELFKINDKAAYQCKGRTLQLIMASGRRLYYMDPQFKMTVPPWEVDKVKEAKRNGVSYTPSKIKALTFMGMCSRTRKWRRMYLHGSKGFQNCVQATARDVLGYAMVKLDQDGWDLRLTVHDQLSSLIETGERSLHDYEKVMTVPPPWAKDLPLECEGWVGDRFRK